MMKVFRSDADIANYVKERNAKVITEAYKKDPSSVEVSRLDENKHIKKEVQLAAENLKENITANLESHPAYIKSRHGWGSKNNMFNKGITYDKDGKRAFITFNMNEMMKPDMYKSPELSFVPILWECGWSWRISTNRYKKGKKTQVSTANALASRNSSFAFYQYFAGTHAISDAITKFNNTYKSSGYTAKFLLRKTEIEEIVELDALNKRIKKKYKFGK